MMAQYIGLLDCNNFFVSCERLFRPDLAQRPVVVLSGNDGCIVARSQEVKELGIPMGVPYFKVKDQLATAKVAIFSSNFTLYRDISNRVMRTLALEVANMEQYSVDEAFFTTAGHSVADIERQLSNLKHTIEQAVGVPVSVGAAATKTIAKYASEKEKRGCGMCVLHPAAWQQEQVNVPLASIWGIGPQLAQKCTTHGLQTVADLTAADPARVQRVFGVVGARIQSELRGTAVFQIGERQKTAQQSIMHTRSFKQTTHDKAVMADALAYHTGCAAAELRALGYRCGSIQIIARAGRHSDWVLRAGTMRQVLDTPTADTGTLITAAKSLLDEMFDPEVPYKKAGVVLSQFTDQQIQQASLFQVSDTESHMVMEMLDALNERFGRDTVTIGRLNKASVWGSETAQLSPQYTTKWQDIRTISL